MNALDLLKKEHAAVGALLDDVQACEAGDERLDALAKSIEQALTVHAKMEEQLFYPKLRDAAGKGEEKTDVFEAYTEHDVLKHLIALLQREGRRDEAFKAELQVLGENVKHHVKEEESTIFKIARDVLSDEDREAIGAKFLAGKAAKAA